MYEELKLRALINIELLDCRPSAFRLGLHFVRFVVRLFSKEMGIVSERVCT